VKERTKMEVVRLKTNIFYLKLKYFKAEFCRELLVRVRWNGDGENTLHSKLFKYGYGGWREKGLEGFSMILSGFPVEKVSMPP